jgi:hypothetical protein
VRVQRDAEHCDIEPVALHARLLPEPKRAEQAAEVER